MMMMMMMMIIKNDDDADDDEVGDDDDDFCLQMINDENDEVVDAIYMISLISRLAKAFIDYQ